MIFTVCRFLFLVKNEIILKPRHVQPFRLQSFRPKDTFKVAKGSGEVFVSDDIGVFPVAPHLFFHFVQPLDRSTVIEGGRIKIDTESSNRFFT
jgi:hypothetical protein